MYTCVLRSCVLLDCAGCWVSVLVESGCFIEIALIYREVFSVLIVQGSIVVYTMFTLTYTPRTCVGRGGAIVEYPAETKSRDAGRSMIGGTHIHIFMFCPINFLWNWDLDFKIACFYSVWTRIWILAPQYRSYGVPEKVHYALATMVCSAVDYGQREMNPNH